jgi:hypothetical protein
MDTRNLRRQQTQPGARTSDEDPAARFVRPVRPQRHLTAPVADTQVRHRVLEAANTVSQTILSKGSVVAGCEPAGVDQHIGKQRPKSDTADAPILDNNV